MYVSDSIIIGVVFGLIFAGLLFALNWIFNKGTDLENRIERLEKQEKLKVIK